MGRVLRRVPLDFDLPIGMVWPGFKNPFYSKYWQGCDVCEKTGSSPEARALDKLWYAGMNGIPFTPESVGSRPFEPSDPVIQARVARTVQGSGYAVDFLRGIEANRLATLYNASWCYHISDDNIADLLREGRLRDLTHDWVDGKPVPNNRIPTREEVRNWSVGGFGHDGINRWIVIKGECDRRGVSNKCAYCDGNGGKFPCNAIKELVEGFEHIEPPAGDGWQMWENTSEGSPISPVFETPEGLATWLFENRNNTVDEGTTMEQWLSFIKSEEPCAPSFVMDGNGLHTGVEALANA